MSVSSKEEDELFELAMLTDPEKALALAESDLQKKRAWEAVKAAKEKQVSHF
jgi:polyphosphate kinase 2 (PPK2 family)